MSPDTQTEKMLGKTQGSWLEEENLLNGMI